MTAAEKKIIIEQGADFKIDIKIYDGTLAYDLNDSPSVKMVIQYVEDADDQADGTPGATGTVGTIVTMDTISGSDANFIVDAANGAVNVTIDKTLTATYPTRIRDLSAFATDYNYFYYIEVVNGTDDMRVLRGKCAVRV